VTKWRRERAIPWNCFTDNTRWHLKSQTFDSLEEALEQTVNTYRRDLWQRQRYYVECWVEKDAIASFVHEQADGFCVPTFVCRGNASLTSLYDAAQTFKAAVDAGKTPVILYLGDHDPTGLCIDESARRALLDDFGVEVEFRRIAVTPDQIEELNLPTRPVKSSDSRAKGWEGGCVEVDALEPATIKDLVMRAIVGFIDVAEWQSLQQVEEMERETIRQMIGGAN
jgi:hypothetical protein